MHDFETRMYDFKIKIFDSNSSGYLRPKIPISEKSKILIRLNGWN